jgi:hypothetical protein
MTRQEQLLMFTRLQKRMASIRHLRSGAITPEQRFALRAAAEQAAPKSVATSVRKTPVGDGNGTSNMTSYRMRRRRLRRTLRHRAFLRTPGAAAAMWRWWGPRRRCDRGRDSLRDPDRGQ